MSVGEDQIASQRQPGAKSVRRRRPTLGEPRFDLLRGLIDSDESCLGEMAKKCGAGIARDEPIEAARFSAERDGDFTPSPRVGRSRLFTRSRSASEQQKGGNGADDRKVSRLSGQKPPSWPENWPVENVCKSAEEIKNPRKFGWTA